MAKCKSAAKTEISGYCGLFNDDGKTLFDSKAKLIVDSDYMLKRLDKYGVAVPVDFTGQLLVCRGLPNCRQQSLLIFMNGELLHVIDMSFKSRSPGHRGEKQ